MSGGLVNAYKYGESLPVFAGFNRKCNYFKWKSSNIVVMLLFKTRVMKIVAQLRDPGGGEHRFYY